MNQLPKMSGHLDTALRIISEKIDSEYTVNEISNENLLVLERYGLVKYSNENWIITEMGKRYLK